MASERQQNFQGQQRVDVPHLRAIESGVANDFDTLAGIMMTGKIPIIVTGFELVTAGIISSAADTIQLNTAGSSLIHYWATESGSALKIPDNRAVEVLSSTNPRVSGGFTPNATNYIGIDLRRTADDSTSDVVQFLNPDTNGEIAAELPLARTLDYVIIISTADFSSTPNVCPVAKVVTNASNVVTSYEDARNLFFRLGRGGSQPSAISPFTWPGGRSEASTLLASIAGDRSIYSLKEWMNAAMTRIWEIGGGEYWYSPNADRNIFFGNKGPVLSGGDHYEFALGHLHWRGAFFSFDNSTGAINEIADQLTDAPGLTDLLEGDCLFVDLDRTQDKTGVNALVAQKAPLATVGASTRPGQRWVFAMRTSAGVVVRGRPFPVGYSLSPNATSAVAGVVRLSAQPNPALGGSFAVTLGNLSTGVATAGGVSHNADMVSATNVPAGNVFVGRGEAAGDHNVLVTTTTATYQTIISGEGEVPVPVATIQNTAVNHNVEPYSKILNIRSFGGTDIETALYVEGIGAIGLRNVAGNNNPFPPADISSTNDVRAKIFMRHNGVASPYRRDQCCIIWYDGTITVMFEGPLY